MKPTLDRALEVCANTLMLEIAPAVSPSYLQSGALSSGVLLLAVREELDRIAERRVEENDALRTLFRDAAATVEAPGLAGRLGEAAASRDESVRISSLDAANDALRALLIELHAELEERDDAASRALCERIWSELVRSTERRRLSLGSF